MLVTINLTQEDIDNGKRKQCDRCPVAIAMLREIPGTNDVRVGSYEAMIKFKDRYTWFYVVLPEAVSEFIYKFDGSQKVSPFSFPLEIPEAA